ncbi:MAG: lysophospholipid acyltransferase family protein [Prevotellaceae bacterium]|nr:lysophospholipid acyltransferase family protein [Prevotellaceae bacterium]
MLNKLTFYLLKFFWVILSIIPLWILYPISDFFALILYYLIRYRRKVVRKNLTTCFPEKSEKEIVNIEKKFYRFFTDMFLEATKLFTYSEKQIMKRMQFVNYEEINAAIRQGKSISLFLGHYGNWEWVSSMALWVDKNITASQIYQRLHNEATDRLIRQNRKKMGVHCVEMAQTLRWIDFQKQANKVSVTGYIADQSPRKREVRHFLPFLNHNIPVLTGAEKICKRYGFEAFYIEVKRLKRGYYKAEVIKIHPNPASLPDFELTKIYYQFLEKTIRQNPEYYLWTHKRFKYEKL